MSKIIPDDMVVGEVRRDLVNETITPEVAKKTLNMEGWKADQIKDIFKWNVRWLLSTLAIHNSDHPDLELVLDKLKDLLPGESPFVLDRLK